MMKSEVRWRGTDYCVEIKTLWRCSLGFWPAPVELQTRLAIRQLEHGDSLSQRICRLKLRLKTKGPISHDECVVLIFPQREAWSWLIHLSMHPHRAACYWVSADQEEGGSRRHSLS